MSDNKFDLKDITSMMQKLFKDIKTSVTEIIDEFKKKGQDNTKAKPAAKKPAAEKKTTTPPKAKKTAAPKKPAAKKED